MTTNLHYNKFALVFIDADSGIPISFIQKMFYKKNGDSIVISARASEVNSNWVDNKFNVRLGGDLAELTSQQIHEYVDSSKQPEIYKFLTENDFRYEYNQISNYSKNILVKRVLILLDLTDVDNDLEYDRFVWSCFRIKKGGIDLISEFLLSSFCHKVTDDLVYLDQPSDIAVNIFTEEYSSEIKEDALERGLYHQFRYTFDILENLDHLVNTFVDLTDYDPDSEYDVYDKKYSINCYYYRLNLNQIKILKGYIKTPQISNEVSSILTEDQKDYLRLHAHRTLISNAKFILDRVLISHGEYLKNFA